MQKDTETYLLDKLKKCLKCGMKEHLHALMGELGHNVVPCNMVLPKNRFQLLYLPKYQMVCKFGPAGKHRLSCGAGIWKG